MDGRFVELFDSRVIQKIRLLLPSWTKQLKNRVLLSTPKYVSRAVRKLGLPIKLYIARRKGLTEGRDVETLLQKGYVKGDAANQPAGLSADEAAAELDIIRRGRSYNDTAGFGRNLELDNGGKPLLEAVATPKRYEYWVKSDNRGMLDSKGFLTRLER